MDRNNRKCNDGMVSDKLCKTGVTIQITKRYSISPRQICPREANVNVSTPRDHFITIFYTLYPWQPKEKKSL